MREVKFLNNQGLLIRARPTDGKRREWEAFLGLIFALGVSPVPAGLADRCQRVVRRWHTDSIGREDLRGDPGVHASEGELDLALARLGA